MNAALAVGAICIGLSLWAILSVKETFGKELNYVEVL
jgi:hypothetical protein